LSSLFNKNGSLFSPPRLIQLQQQPTTTTTQPIIRTLSSSSSTTSTVAPPLSTLSPEESALKQAVSSWAKDVLLPRVRKMDEAKKIDTDIIKSLFDQGFMGIETSEALGGSGMSFTSAIIAIEELAKVDPSVSVCVDVQNTLVNNMFKFYANDDVKQRFLPRLAKDTIGCFCLSESGSGSDAFALATRAQDLGSGGFKINGSKQWITNGGEAGIFVVMANLNPSAGYKGITTFVLEKGMKGLEVGRTEDKLGIRASSTTPITFTDVIVPRSNVLGEIGKGYKYAIEILNEGRIGIAAQMVGCAQGAYDATLPYLHQRKQFGKPLAEFQAIQMQVANMAIEIEAARNLTMNAARLKESGAVFVKEAAMAKYFSSQVAKRVTMQCVELMGGVGFTKDMPQEKFYRDSIIGSIYEGTSNIQLQTIAKLVLPEYKV
jgi:short/branched chain acyl-CoA dehydrogenase